MGPDIVIILMTLKLYLSSRSNNTTSHPIPLLQFKSEMVKKKKFKRFCPHCERHWVCPSGVPVNMIFSMILMIEDVEEADVFEEDVQMFEFLPRRLFQGRNLHLLEDDLSERRGENS